MKPLAIFGTGTGVGKSSLVMALCRIFADQGLKVAPFKAQTITNNSAVAQQGREISMTQYMQAEAANVEPSYLFNPIVLKVLDNHFVEVIVNGVVHKKQHIGSYFAELNELKFPVQKAFSRLQQDYDLVIAQGTGSIVNLNEIEKQLTNTFIAQSFNTKNILLADAEKGEVFTTIYGAVELMDPLTRSQLLGVVINKSKATTDERWLHEGEQLIKSKLGLPLLGVLPHHRLNFNRENVEVLRHDEQRLDDIKIKVAVICYPGACNFNDLDVLMADPEIYIDLIDAYVELNKYDLVLLPGSKAVISDLQWLKEQGLFNEIQDINKPIFGLCGGYQMLSRSLYDPIALEHEITLTEEGLGFIDDIVIYESPKILQRGNYQVDHFLPIKGYEIHSGRLNKYPLYYQSGRYTGTHIQGIFDDNAFRNDYFRTINPYYQGYDYTDYRQTQIDNFTQSVADNLDISTILQMLQEGSHERKTGRY